MMKFFRIIEGMKSDLYIRKKLRRSLLSLGMGAMFLTFSLFFVGMMGMKTKKFTIDRTFYFLCEQSKKESISVSVQTNYLDGGAGYALTREDKNYVVLAAYNDLADAQKVAENLKVQTEVLPLELDTFYFTTAAQREVFSRVQGCVNTLLQCSDLLYKTANRLTMSEFTQREGRSIVQEIDLVLGGLLGEATEQTRNNLQAQKDKCKEILSDVIYAKDLRYLQLMMIEGIYDLQQEFSL